MNTLKSITKSKAFNNNWLPLPLAAILSYVFIHLTWSQDSVWATNWDEAAYIYAGWLVSRGYNPYPIDIGVYVNPPMLP